MKIVKIECFLCKNVFDVNVENIPENATYEAKCPRCGMVLKRKKVTTKCTER